MGEYGILGMFAISNSGRGKLPIPTSRNHRRCHASIYQCVGPSCRICLSAGVPEKSHSRMRPFGADPLRRGRAGTPGTKCGRFAWTFVAHKRHGNIATPQKGTDWTRQGSKRMAGGASGTPGDLGAGMCAFPRLMEARFGRSNSFCNYTTELGHYVTMLVQRRTMPPLHRKSKTRARAPSRCRSVFTERRLSKEAP